ncbi:MULTISPECIES: MBL fold metallo-hydrolase [Nocardiaceae]|uniref:MBL fold metallo-hydrolase n=1 Tax=Nocardiaceae TaxID=85025 RepID=UPI00068EB99D|nr:MULTISPECIES: MBL fold metallo-hydrolase [Rhodococcus]OZD12094.1 MBL fold metallo-hydrolase [Rhodococcus sp. 06-156-4a]OZD15763.1 MBL fold metallo-hydrolase [Rhodococcus sp. 06-156-3C]OZD21147.1 MBL fold metallo-hydrolase [Rhodococcus sp. 06-156-4C]OZD32329.1 MBL fold metallo-hydrolase [Rhodococcus sp. 06-156-3]OZD36551.1 MBL fold metallo-hydrolase [Rhodococcus sp. 06-156-3b]
MPITSPIPFTSAVHWPIGRQTFTSVSDGYYQTDLTVFPSFDHAEASALQRAAHRAAEPRISHNMYVVRGPDHAPILIDAGMGDGWGSTMGHLPWALSSIGVGAEEVGTVLLTHLHLDHCAGLIDPDGTPRFPNAQVVVHAAEVDHWLGGDAESPSDDDPPWAPSVTRRGASAALAPYRDALRTFDHEQVVAPGITAVPLIGHSPGHSGYRVGAGADSILVIGDIVHVPAVQGPRPDACVVFDVDRDAAVAARGALFEAADRNGFRIAGAHTEFPGVGFVERAGDGYRVVPDLWVGSLDA